jgi:hypothetical protein
VHSSPFQCRVGFLMEPFKRAVRRGPGLHKESTCSVQRTRSPIRAAAAQKKDEREHKRKCLSVQDAAAAGAGRRSGPRRTWAGPVALRLSTFVCIDVW